MPGSCACPCFKAGGGRRPVDRRQLLGRRRAGANPDAAVTYEICDACSQTACAGSTPAGGIFSRMPTRNSHRCVSQACRKGHEGALGADPGADLESWRQSPTALSSACLFAEGTAVVRTGCSSVGRPFLPGG